MRIKVSSMFEAINAAIPIPKRVKKSNMKEFHLTNLSKVI
jgi:hypothetical protein